MKKIKKTMILCLLLGLVGCDTFIMDNELYNQQDVQKTDYIVLESVNIMVQTKDISSGVDWNSANTLCKNSRVGGFSDWRLPTIGELSALYTNRTTIGGFSTTYGSCYWSSSLYDGYYADYYYYDFYRGKQNYNDEDNNYHVRAVRTLP